MARKRGNVDLIGQFIDRIESDLRNDESGATTQAIKRRKLRTVTHQCGFKKASLPFLERVRRQLAKSDIYTIPSLLDPGLNPDDWVRFSKEPIPLGPLVFRKEKHLQSLVLAALGQGIFRNLKPFRTKGNPTGIEFQLSNKRRIDLLCQERTKHRAGTLVAIEFKRHGPQGAVGQLASYLTGLKKEYPKRDVRGIIISGPDDPDAPFSIEEAHGHDIVWYRYRVEFEQQPGSR